MFKKVYKFEAQYYIKYRNSFNQKSIRFTELQKYSLLKKSDVLTFYFFLKFVYLQIKKKNRNSMFFIKLLMYIIKHNTKTPNKLKFFLCVVPFDLKNDRLFWGYLVKASTPLKTLKLLKLNRFFIQYLRYQKYIIINNNSISLFFNNLNVLRKALFRSSKFRLWSKRKFKKLRTQKYFIAQKTEHLTWSEAWEQVSLKIIDLIKSKWQR